MSYPVDISGLDKVQVLHCLWRRSAPPVAVWKKGEKPMDFDVERARAAGEQWGWNIGIVCGRRIASDLSGEFVCPVEYDRSCGDGAMREAVSCLRSKIRKSE